MLESSCRSERIATTVIIARISHISHIFERSRNRRTTAHSLLFQPKCELISLPTTQQVGYTRGYKRSATRLCLSSSIGCLLARICDDIYVDIRKIVCASRGERERAQSWFFLFNPKRYIQMIGKANKDSIYCMLSVYINFFGAAAAVKLSWVFWPTTTTTTMTGRVSIWMISPQS